MVSGVNFIERIIGRIRFFKNINERRVSDLLTHLPINSMNDAQRMSFAYEIADALNDRKSIDVHIAFVKKYSEEYLRSIMEYVLARPDSEITSSRGAYYTYLVKKNGGHIRY